MTMNSSRFPARSGRARRITALGLTALFVAATAATTTACGADRADGAKSAPKAATSSAPAEGKGKGLKDVEGKAYGYNPYAWATRSKSTIGIYGIVLHGQSFTVGGQVKLVLFKDGGVPGVPVWYRTTTARSASGRHGGGFDVTTGKLDCTAYYPGRAANSTLMALDVTTNTWSNKVRVATDCES
ncbi:hypothetical protein [Streptomyces sp. NPDC046909]|uniref:hypothetical protein n=1 Tax=Streptomyces sp. NPDC046909 TaxID=3155617 RepID=UPI0034090C06